MPNERQAFTLGLFWLTVFLLIMAWSQPDLWKIDIFKTILQVVVVTGLINMAGGFNFAASKGDEAKTANTKAAFDAITATANASTPSPDVILKPGDTAQAEESKP